MSQKVDEGKIEISLSKAERQAQQAALDAERSRKKGKKQKKTQEVVYDEFNFDINIIQNFATISVNPPNEVQQLDQTIKSVQEKKQWYIDNGENKLSEQIAEIKKEQDEEDKEYIEEMKKAAAPDNRPSDRGQRGGYQRRGRGDRRNYGPINEFDGGDEDDDQAYAPPTRVRNKKQKKEDLIADDENFPAFGEK